MSKTTCEYCHCNIKGGFACKECFEKNIVTNTPCSCSKTHFCKNTCLKNRKTGKVNELCQDCFKNDCFIQHITHYDTFNNVVWEPLVEGGYVVHDLYQKTSEYYYLDRSVIISYF